MYIPDPEPEMKRIHNTACHVFLIRCLKMLSQIYHNLCLGRDLTLSSLIHYPPMNQEAAASLLKLGCEKGNLAGLQQIYSYCLYGLPDND